MNRVHGEFDDGTRWTITTRTIRTVSGSVDVEADVAVSVRDGPHVRVTLESWRQKFSEWFGPTRELKVGDPRFDDRYFLESKDDKALPALQNPELRGAIEGAFAKGATALIVTPRRLTVTLPVKAVQGTSREILLAVLHRAAKSLDRTRMGVKVLGGERRAFTGPNGTPRCGYCRDDITGREPDLVACRRCSTVLHEECWNELGHCPVLGCKGKNPEKREARA